MRIVQLSVPSSSGKTLQHQCAVRTLASLLSLSVPSSSGKTLQRSSGNRQSAQSVRLSVPSSSGKTLQPACDADGSDPCRPFSPLFIGEDSSTIASASMPDWSHSLSVPSSSGKTLQRSEQVGSRIRQVRLSVPSSSGKTLQPRSITCERVLDSTFSPLFIGEDSSTHVQRSDDRCIFTFQSPLHRGRLFNAVIAMPAARRFRLSVPSSSGKTLQRMHAGACRTDSQPFSPLFIGEDSSTVAGSFDRLQRQRYHCLSVPSSSGKTLQLRDSHAGLRSCIFQSPLHRGRLFNAATTSADVMHFQSPLHRGRLFNSTALTLRTSLSVPSSSGKTLQRRQWSFSMRSLSSSFSPLFIGEDSSTAFYPLPFQQLAGSILSDFSQRPYLQKNPAGLRKH